MKRKEDRPMSKHTVFLYEDDMEWLKTHHGRLGASKVIRALVAKHRKRVEESVNGTRR